MTYRYTVAICHLNMVDTVEESLLSIHNHTDEEFEILVVDDGSTDGSLELIEQLSDEYERIQLVNGDNDNIAQARNSSIRNSSGDFVLHQLDADDKYDGGILDFTRVFEELDRSTDNPVYLRGKNMHLASKELLQRVPYRDVGYGEDLDLWRRMDAKSDVEMVWLQHEPVNESIGYERSFLEYLGVRYSTAKVNFQTGITPSSYVRWMLQELAPNGWTTRPWYGSIFHIGITFVAYLNALHDGVVEDGELPPHYRDFSWYMNHILNETRTLSELESEYDFKMDQSKFSDVGERMFYGDGVPSPENTVP